MVSVCQMTQYLPDMWLWFAVDYTMSVEGKTVHLSLAGFQKKVVTLKPRQIILQVTAVVGSAFSVREAIARHIHRHRQVPPYLLHVKITLKANNLAVPNITHIEIYNNNEHNDTYVYRG